MSASARHSSRRRIAAFNFLSNISLDGTHRDTKYSMFLKRGLDHVLLSEKNHRQVESVEHKTSQSRRASVSDHIDSLQVQPENHRASQKNGLKLKEYSNENQVTPDNKELLSSKRAKSFSEAKVLATRRRRSLFHTYSISEDSSEIEYQQTSSMHVSLSKSSGHGVRMRHKSTSDSQDSLGSGSKSNHSQSKINKMVKFASKGDKFQRNDRVVLLTGSKIPFAVFSTLPYCKPTKHGSESQKKKQDKISMMFPTGNEALHTLVLGSEDSQAVSYSKFLVPSKKAATTGKRNTIQESQLYPIAENNSTTLSPGENKDGMYDPSLLDDPELKSGKHRTLMTFPSYMTSVIDYAKPSDLKKELNEKFKEMFPHIQLTLTKLRSLKQDLKKIAAFKCGIDLWSVAQAYVFFEKIILKGLIQKCNRRLVASACLILSAKLNDVKGVELTKLIDELEDYFKLNRKDLLKCEFVVLVALEFSLLIPDKDIAAHHQRLIFNS